MKKFLLSIILAMVVFRSPVLLRSSVHGQSATPVDDLTLQITPAAPQTLSSNDSFITFLPMVSQPPEEDWPMVAANPERTSWAVQQVSGNLHVVWYRPVEAYIPQNAQIIASNDLLYVSTSKGLYALNAANGAVAWRFDTEMPLGNSPTVSKRVVYVGGYDRKLHALDAVTGTHLWEFTGAQAGYDTNPLVIENKVIVGNRDGNLYAIGAHRTPDQGQLIWKFQAGGPIHISAAYKNGVVYFAANDNHAYAVSSDTGTLLWKSPKLPGDGYHSYWPVIYQDKVIFSASSPYRMGINPGTQSVIDDDGIRESSVNEMQVKDLLLNDPRGTQIGPLLPAQDWSHGYPVIDASRVSEYLEENPHRDPDKHKPWRRTFIVLNAADGSEYLFDTDRDGYMEHAPVVHWGTNSGSRYPPVVGPDGILYMNNLYQMIYDAQGKVMGWKIGTQYLSVLDGQGAIQEPQALSMGGNLIYRNICVDRLGDYFDINRNGVRRGVLWSYNLSELAPGYDETWTVLPGWPRAKGWYKGNTSSINGIYHNGGDQNPLIPYEGHIYTHRSNAIIAFGTGPALGKLPLIRIQSPSSSGQSLSPDELRARLESEVLKIIQAGHLRPGYYNVSQFSLYKDLADYFENPGDTLYTLAIAYPYLSPELQEQTRIILRQEFQTYFDPVMYSSIGWAEGAPRESMPLPMEVQEELPNLPKSERAQNSSWSYPQHNFYALWKYTQIFPDQAGRAYDLAKSKLVVPTPAIATTAYFREKPYELNAYIAGYVGFLQLQILAGRTSVDAQLRTSVTNELNRLYQLRASIFDKDTLWMEDYYNKRTMIVARNFVFLVPELGDYLNRQALAEAQEAVSEYQYIAPYWFVSRYESILNEGAMSPLYNSPAMFQAKAYILKLSQAELSKYIDVPAFETGDLHYIQNLVAALQAR